ncbi:D-xylose transporter subunit; membrane component of ABC superfamily protein [Beijerinckiaceae bacterium RH AL1]|nr:sugar ABC transporter permease [Beijerinckiaceae bacterium]VVB43577.1 D-xylose transporter subunit; membrane component of ABC superfamily protein [Beijerinckiaceae bacterium RH AL8]VVB43595.1 D-xylose transporter subunit; membrane component of ABC superfamily protein [Beijerinckiaceae bacterium RH CH11]VVC53911.1 D-xylose transporter subunit; membrane component of ABC superfamily protein [Beijerinckiaceae bacterium RH AL1]
MTTGLDVTATAPAVAPPTRSLGAFLKTHVREYGMLASLAAITLFFEIMTNGTLLRPLNLTNLVLQNSYIVIMALGMLLVIVAGHIDLSVGSISGFIGAVAAVMMVSHGLNPFVAGFACLALGAVIGAIQGGFVAYMKIPSFIVTLAGMLVFRGLSLTVLQGRSIGPFPVEFQRLSSGFIPDFGATLVGHVHVSTVLIGLLVPSLLVVAQIRHRLAARRHAFEVEPLVLFVLGNAIAFLAIAALAYQMATYRGLPNVLVVMGLLIVVYAFMTTRTTVGRRIYALGGNEKAAKLSGIRTERLTFLVFVNMGMLAALAGLIFAARLNTATPKAGLSFELDVIAACFIGGASSSGGVGKITGAVVGAFVMGVMNNGMSILGIGIDWQQVIKGLVLLAAVVFDVYNRGKT